MPAKCWMQVRWERYLHKPDTTVTSRELHHLIGDLLIVLIVYWIVLEWLLIVQLEVIVHGA